MSSGDIDALRAWGFPTTVVRLNPDVTDVLPLYMVVLPDDHAVFDGAPAEFTEEDCILGSWALHAVMRAAKMEPKWSPNDVDIWVHDRSEINVAARILNHLAAGRSAKLGPNGSTAVFSAQSSLDIQEVYDDWIKSIAIFDISVAQVGLTRSSLVFCEDVLADIAAGRMRVCKGLAAALDHEGHDDFLRGPERPEHGLRAPNEDVTTAGFERLRERARRYRERGFLPVEDDSQFGVNRLSSLFLYYIQARVGVPTAAAPGVLSNADFSATHNLTGERPAPLSAVRALLADIKTAKDPVNARIGCKRARVE